MSHARELPAKFKYMAGAGVISGGIDPGKIKDFHEIRNNLGKGQKGNQPAIQFRTFH